MEVRIKKLSETRLAGRSIEMSISMDRTRELWSSFMPLLGRIDHRLGTDLYNVQFYSEDFYKNGVDPSRKFVKWAAAAVEEENMVPDGLELLVLPEGLYAVYEHIGPASDFPNTLQFFYGQWLPNSNYRLDHRAHFEILPENYRPDDPEAREEVWIPIRPK